MKQWRVEIRLPFSEDIKFLAKRFRSSRLRVVNDSDRAWLLSSRFDGTEEVEEVRTIAVDLLRLALGIARFHYVDLPEPRLGAIISHNEDGTNTLHGHVEFGSLRSVRAKQGYHVDPDGNICETPQLPSETALIDLATQYPHVRDAFATFSSTDGWWSLYKIYEIIAQDFSNQDSRLLKAGLADGLEELQNFKRTANDYRTGFHARHGTPRNPPPRQRMSVEDGRIFVGEMMRRWVSHLHESPRPSG